MSWGGAIRCGAAAAVMSVAGTVSAEEVGPREVMGLVAGNPRLEVAAADIDQAQARLIAAEKLLIPDIQLMGSYDRFDSAASQDRQHDDLYATLSVVAPIYDFGSSKTFSQAARAEIAASESARLDLHHTLMLEGLALYFELAASELEVQARNEEHASAFVRHGRAVERQEVGQTSGLEVAATNHRVEQTRLAFYRARSHNRALRLRLAELTGASFDEEVFAPPPPAAGPAEVETQALVEAAISAHPAIAALEGRGEAARLRRLGTGFRPRVEAFGEVGETNRTLRGRNQWSVGARFVWPLYDGTVSRAERARLAAHERRYQAELVSKRRDLERAVQEAVMDRADAWQQLVAAKAALDHAKHKLIDRRLRYEQERVTDIGRAMWDTSDAEAGLIRATGSYRLANARLAALLGRDPRHGLDDGFPDKPAP